MYINEKIKNDAEAVANGMAKVAGVNGDDGEFLKCVDVRITSS